MSAKKTNPDELDLFCYGVYLRAVSGDQYLAETIPAKCPLLGVCAPCMPSPREP